MLLGIESSRKSKKTWLGGLSGTTRTRTWGNSSHANAAHPACILFGVPAELCSGLDLAPWDKGVAMSAVGRTHL